MAFGLADAPREVQGAGFQRVELLVKRVCGDRIPVGLPFAVVIPAVAAEDSAEPVVGFGVGDNSVRRT